MKSRFIGLFVFVGFITVALVGICWADKSFADGGGGWIGTGSPTYSSSGGGSGGSYYGGNVCDDDARAASYLECQGYSWIFYRYIGDAAGMKEGVVFRPDSSTNTVSSQCTQHTNGGFWHFGYNMRGIEYSDYYSVFGNWRYVRGLDNSVRVTYSTSLDGRGHAETLTRKVISPNGYYGWINGIGDGYDNHYFTHNKNELSHVIYVDGKAVYRAEKYSSNPDTNSDAAVLKDYKRACKAGGGSDSECAQIPDDAYAFCYWAGLEQGDNMGRVRILGSSSTSDNYDTFTGWKKTTDWVKTEKTIDYTVEDCSEGGCGVQFRHYLRNTKGNGTTQYKIVRSLNGVDTETFTGKKNLSDGSNDWVMSNVVTMKPGQTVCETLYWSKDENTAPGGTPYAKACVKAKELPPPPDENTTVYEAKIDMTVKNSSLSNASTYRNYQKETFVKPGDNVEYRVEYDSAPQYVYDNTKPKKLIVDNGDNVIDGSGNQTTGSLFNSWSGTTWMNAYCIAGGLLDNKCGEYSEGVSSKETEVFSAKANGVAGNAFSDVAKTLDKDDSVSSGLVTPTRASVTKLDNTVTTVDLSTEPIMSEARVYVPYNFANTTAIDGSNRIVYAGEMSEVSYKVGTVSRRNEVLEGEYETAVGGGGKRRVTVCHGDDCNSEEAIITKEEWGGEWSAKSYVLVGDLPAGTKVMVQSAVWPKNSVSESGNELVWDLSDGWETYCPSSNEECWESSEWVEFTVAKRPSFQVWGGSLYSGSDIDARSATKMTIADGYSGDLPRTFGSWTELALVEGAGNDDMASGAGFGYTADGWNGRIKDESYDTLTYGGSSGSDKKLELSYVEGLLGDNYKKKLDDGSILSGIVPSGNGEEARKFLYAFEGNISIMMNIEVDRDGSMGPYHSFEETPSVVIYTTGNISISCGVKRIDAILIAGGTINTCGQDGSNNSFSKDDIRERDVFAERLVVNGALWAQSINFYRPVGAKTGRESGEPAEIINYDSSFVIPGTGSVDAGRDETTLGNFVVEAVSELAPRY